MASFVDIPSFEQPRLPDWDYWKPEHGPIDPEFSKPKFGEIAKTAKIVLDMQPYVQFTGDSDPFRGACCNFEVAEELLNPDHWECRYYICNEDGSRVDDRSVRGKVIKTKDIKTKKPILSILWRRLTLWDRRDKYQAGLKDKLVEGKFYRVGLEAIYRGEKGPVKKKGDDDLVEDTEGKDDWFMVFGSKWKALPPSSNLEQDRSNRYFWPGHEAYDFYIFLNYEDYKSKERDLWRLPSWPPRIYVKGVEKSYVESEGSFRLKPPNPEALPGYRPGDEV